jgi:predicted nucleotide-binding protein (sugar kinase/HSP70/actin superfamily)
MRERDVRLTDGMPAPESRRNTSDRLTAPFQHYRVKGERPLTESERRRVTVLFGGATWKHERLMQGTLERIGYRAKPLPPIVHRDFLSGKDYIDAGACCPAAFTAGNLINFLRDAATELGPEQVVSEYVFVTAGGCGPCRFGHYQESYALALEGMGLPDFRVLLLDLKGVGHGAFQATVPFTLGMCWAVMCADLLTELEYMTRPYEVVPGDTDRAVKECVELIYDSVRNQPDSGGRYRTVLWYLTTDHYRRTLRRVLKKFSRIRVDRLRVKPMVKVTGEFWLQAHEGDGNYRIKQWLESEEAEVAPPIYTAWFDFLLQARRDRAWERRGSVSGARTVALYLLVLSRLLHRAYNGLRASLANIPPALPSQPELQRLAAPYYHYRLEGGESYCLIGKALHAYLHRTAHMICELSPYGCLPNTMSVGAMAGVLRHYPDLLYAPIEIKGDAEVQAISRCQMYLTEAHRRARTEFEQALNRFSLTPERIREHERGDPSLCRADTRIPHHGYAGTAANYVAEVAARIAGR